MQGWGQMMNKSCMACRSRKGNGLIGCRCSARALIRFDLLQYTVFHHPSLLLMVHSVYEQGLCVVHTALVRTHCVVHTALVRYEKISCVEEDPPGERNIDLLSRVGHSKLHCCPRVINDGRKKSENCSHPTISRHHKSAPLTAH